MNNNQFKKGFGVSKQEREMLKKVSSYLGYKTVSDAICGLIKNWKKTNELTDEAIPLGAKDFMGINANMTMHEMNRLNKLSVHYGMTNNKVIRNMIRKTYAKYEQEIAEAGRKQTEPDVQEEPVEQVVEPTVSEQAEPESLFPTEEFVADVNSISLSYRKRMDITDEEYEIARMCNFEIGDLIDCEYKAVESGERKIFDFCQEADADNASGKKPATLQYKLAPDKQAELKLLCDFYGKEETEIVRHVLYSTIRGKYGAKLQKDGAIKGFVDTSKYYLLWFPLTSEELAKDKETNFRLEMPYYIDREYEAIKSGNRNVSDFNENATEGVSNRDCRGVCTLVPIIRTELAEVCKFYGKSEAEVSRHILHSLVDGKYEVVVDLPTDEERERIEEQFRKRTAKDVLEIAIQEGFQDVHFTWRDSSNRWGHAKVEDLTHCSGELSLLKMMLYDLNIEDVFEKSQVDEWRKYYETYADAVETAYRTGEYKAIVL